MNQYEITLVFRANLEEEQRTEVINRLMPYITAGAAEAPAMNIKNWGKRSLAYPIKKEHEGHYVLLECAMQPEAVRDLERNILYTDQILRHLVVRRD